ncbi:related to U6 snRNA-associated Sm-like protein LSm4 [Melanopsichium pennsylvanicum]|uniref:LSM complex subunit LSM4 n=1 Tax=Melanopsichium pennsylvanicum TaxID=63383 RepID=A0AAJ5C2X6_9BASI|nr:related to U6 snRNA-associated Sm-like protein LSm4 [Melanopsichium pennsylvanicum]
MLPLSLLNAAQNKPMLVELKNGSTFNGHLVACDNFMNLTLREVYETSASGEQFWKQKECYIRGSTEEVARKQRQQGGGGLSGGVSLGHNRGGGGGHAHGGRGGYQNRGGGRGGHNTEQRGGRGGHRGRGRGQ